MGLILDVVMKNAEDHPFVNLSHCVNRNQRRVACRKCIKICPRQVFDQKLAAPPKWDLCQNCGLCVSACTTRCLAPSAVNVKRHLLLAQKQGPVTISCQRAEKPQGHIEECIALLPWELLAYLALGGKLTLNLSACRACPHEDCYALMKETLNRLQRFLGEEGFKQRIQMHTSGDPLPAQEDVSRRGFFQNMSRSGKKAGEMVLADAIGNQTDGLIYRRMLARRVREHAQQGSISCRMEIPWFSQDCYACGICASLCPNQAIEISEEKDGRRRMYVTPHKCTGCGVCLQVCRENGIEEIALAKLPTLDRLMAADVPSASCISCGKAIRPGEQQLCIVCQQKNKKRR